VHWFTRGLQPRVWNFRPPSIGCLRIAGCIPIWAAEERNSYARDSFAYGFDFTRPHSRHERVARLDALATLLDTAFILPGTNVRFGLDALIGMKTAASHSISVGMPEIMSYALRTTLILPM
jgi:hypothetical protein